MFNNTDNGKLLKYLKGLKHPFVVLVLSIYALFTILGINGSSIGVYSRDPSGLVASDRIGRPRPIRSDEWLVNTQLTISQKEAGYPLVNPNIGKGENVSVVFDVPYKEWSTLFKPQNLAFFILPFASAFAFKWWFSTVMMLISSYFAAHFFLKKKQDARLLSSLLAICISFSSMLVWWHQATTVTALSIAYLMLIANFIFRSVDPDSKQASRRTKLLQYALSTYVIASWAMLMYPPFQIASALSFAAIVIGYILSKISQYGSSLREKTIALLKVLAPYILGVLSALFIFALFIYTRKEIIEIIQSTAYPGRRNVLSGGVYLKDLAFGSYDYALQFGTRAADLSRIASNQSELSSIGPWWYISIALMPILIILQRAKNGLREVDPKAVLLTATSLAILVRMLIPMGDILYKPLLLNLVPHNRLKIAFIVLGFFALIVWILESEKLDGVKKLPRNLLLLAVSIATFASGRLMATNVPDFLSGNLEILIVSMSTSLILYLAIERKTLPLLLALSSLTILSVATVNPLQRGLGVLDPGSEQFAIAKEESSKLISKDDLVLESSSILQESLAELLGHKSLTAVYGYPQKELWKDIKPMNEDLYNRYAHINADMSGVYTGELNLELQSSDSFAIKGNFCDLKDFKFDELKVTKVLTTSESNSRCLERIGSFMFMNKTILVYKVV